MCILCFFLLESQKQCLRHSDSCSCLYSLFFFAVRLVILSISFCDYILSVHSVIYSKTGCSFNLSLICVKKMSLLQSVPLQYILLYNATLILMHYTAEVIMPDFVKLYLFVQKCSAPIVHGNKEKYQILERYSTFIPFKDESWVHTNFRLLLAQWRLYCANFIKYLSKRL